MSEQNSVLDRLSYRGEIEPVINRIAQNYEIGTIDSFKVMEIGYEDCNVLIEADNRKYIAKMFAKSRKPEDVERYVSIIRTVVDAGIQHPNLKKQKEGGDLYRDEAGINLVLLDFAEGRTFLEMDRAPDEGEFTEVLEQAAKINGLDFHPPYVFDSWAVPTIVDSYAKVRKFISNSDRVLVDQVVESYEKIPVKNLPHAFVHGDITKANVVLGDDGQVYILDFSVSNWYPRIQELAVMVANLRYDSKSSQTLEQIVSETAKKYGEFGTITDEEIQLLYPYTLGAVAMEYIGGTKEKYISGHDHEETDYWIELGRNSLRKALKT